MLRVNLTGVTFTDDAGQICLRAMHCQGAELIAADPLTKGIVAEITQGPLPECGHPKGDDEGQVRRAWGTDRSAEEF